MQQNIKLWGQTGATFHLTRNEIDTLLKFDAASKRLFIKLVGERRYEVDDQFYSAAESPGEKDIFIHLSESGKTDTAWSSLEDKASYPEKIWCRKGIALSLDARQTQILKQQGKASADLIFDLIESGQYKVEGQCLFEGGLELEGYTGPDEDESIDFIAEMD